MDINNGANLCIFATSKESISMNKFKYNEKKGFACGSPKLIKIETKKEGFSSLKFRPDDQLFVSCGWDKRVRVFNGKNGSPLAVLKSHTDVVNDLCFSPTNKSVFVTSSADKNICIWSLY